MDVQKEAKVAFNPKVKIRVFVENSFTDLCYDDSIENLRLFVEKFIFEANSKKEREDMDQILSDIFDI